METKFDPKDAFERKPRIVGVVASPADWELVTRSGFSELDLCELRMDLLITEQIQPNEYLKPLPLPKILTIRDPREGGKESLTENERLRLFGELLPHVDYIDIELRNLGLYAEVIAGAHTLAASTAQDTLYEASNTSGGYAVGLKATTVTYSGALTGTPNKVITLSAKLVDATGTPLAGRTINFQLGTQSASALTDANGQAATTLKLTQKNGTYTVSATFTPVGADATH